jgi:hypothetical protein
MSWKSWDNLDHFINLEEFGIEVQRQDAKGVIHGFCGLFDQSIQIAELGTYAISTSSPRLVCKAEDAREISRGDVLQIQGQRYLVGTEPQPDGTGLAQIELHAEAPEGVMLGRWNERWGG